MIADPPSPRRQREGNRDLMHIGSATAPVKEALVN